MTESDDLSPPRRRIPIAVVGVGKIARDQHIPCIATGDDFLLTAAASRNARVGGVDCFSTLAELLEARPDVEAVALCTPPQARYADAHLALSAGKHVLLEKPPGSTLSEVQDLAGLAASKGLTLHASWHARHAAAVEAARDWLAAREIRAIDIRWREDVRRWHPGQDWIWAAAGLGVFDPGINALAILTHLRPGPMHVTGAELLYPSNRDAPIAARLAFHDPRGAAIRAEFDWRLAEGQEWTIRIETEAGDALLSNGGACFEAEGARVFAGPDLEYAAVYARFAALIAAGASDVDLSPMRHVADAFMMGRRRDVEPFDG